MNFDDDVITVLAVDCPLGESTHGLDVTFVATARAALAALRVMQFDLMVTTTTVAGEPVWPLAAKVRAVRPRLRWVLIDGSLDDAGERLARSLGATLVANANVLHGGILDASDLFVAWRKPSRGIQPFVDFVREVKTAEGCMRTDPQAAGAKVAVRRRPTGDLVPLAHGRQQPT
jgi:hypothetical protein